MLFSLTFELKANQNETEDSSFFYNLCTRQRLTNGLWGLSENLDDGGIETGFSLTNIYQQNVHGGMSTHSHAGRNSGSYDLELLLDLEKLIGLKNGNFFIHGEGGWPDTEGISDTAVGSMFNVNADAIGNSSLNIIECFYEGDIFDETLKIMVGKIDMAGTFDCSCYADCECTQFMNAALVDNASIPFPDYSLGSVLRYEPTKSLYFMGGIADAEANGSETGFETTFCKEDYFLYMFEAGIKSELNSSNGTLPGTYRVGFWNDPQPKANSDSERNYKHDIGFYLSCDQMLLKENSDIEDKQGLGAFLRYGYADGKKNDITNFWSAGFQYQGILEGRDEDVIAAGFAQGIFSNSASTTYPEDSESALELYYNASLTPWINISPSLQYITNPGGSNTTSDAFVIGLRAQIVF